MPSPPTSWIIQKVDDEGSSSPIIARLMIGLLSLRNNALDDAKRGQFDTAYEGTLTSLFAARDAMRELTRLWDDHARRVSNREIARAVRNDIQVDESVDRRLGQAAVAYVNSAARTMKVGMQDVSRILGVEIGFLFQKEQGFQQGIDTLSASDPALADYLQEARPWSESLQLVRNDIEHNGWSLPRVGYSRTAEGIEAIESPIADMPATSFAASTFERVACFMEEVTAHLLARQLPRMLALAEIPREGRKTEKPERFRLILASSEEARWAISPSTRSFDQS